MSINIDEYMAKLHTESAEDAALPPRLVRKTDGTTEESPYARPTPEKDEAVLDQLFNRYAGYARYKKEQPWHRIVLWHMLQGMKVKDIAALLGRNPVTVQQVSRQPWFQEAFCKLSTEVGKDALTSLLEGEVINTAQALIHLRDNAESEAVRLAAGKEILDRIRGKAVAKVDIKSTATLDVAVFDAEKLLAEQQRLAQTLKDRGVGTN